MRSSVERRVVATVAASLMGLAFSAFNPNQQAARAAGTPAAGATATETTAKFNARGSGMLAMLAPDGSEAGQCPLKHTSVKADIAGYVARVTVKQVFENTSKDKIEAVYTFPLSDSAAVDEMEMKIGNRIIRGNIKKREEARQIYDDARRSGRVASLLDQERTNIFTQSVANIEPGAKIEITIKYVDLLPYEAGNYTFAFPTVVGPRFMPGTPIGHSGLGRTPDTNMVPDASKISPVVAEERSGTDLDIDVHINEGGLPIAGIASKLHEIDLTKRSSNDVELSLKNKHTIPNKDFVLTWGVSGDKLQSGYLTHRQDDKKGYFTVMIMPPKRVRPADIAPKEMIFLIDCSGSQRGLPLQKAKDAMSYILDHMNDNDTFQIISFNNNVMLSSDKPEKATGPMRDRAHAFINSLEANGGTWMAPAVEQACSLPTDANRLRIVTFMTDGLVGNDYQIIGMVRKFRGNSRWFPFGTGNSVNRALIDGIASEGGGEPEYVLLNSSAEAVGKKFYDRISSPVLTDINLDWHGLPVKEVFPHAISDVWAERPLYIAGTYTKPAAGTLTISGFAGGQPYKQDLKVVFPEKQTANDVLGPIWARKKVDRLMAEDWFGAQSGNPNKELKDEIVQVALDHHIMTQYTSFVAVDESKVTKGGDAKTVAVPVDMPEGVSREATIGQSSYHGPVMKAKRRSQQNSISYGGGYGAGTGGVAGNSSQNSAALPPTTMGKFVHQAGDNHYAYGKKPQPARFYSPGAFAPPPPTVTGSSSMAAAPSGTGDSATEAPQAYADKSNYGSPGWRTQARSDGSSSAAGGPKSLMMPSAPITSVRGGLMNKQVVATESTGRQKEEARKAGEKQDKDLNSDPGKVNESKEPVIGNDHSKLEAKLNQLFATFSKTGKGTDEIHVSNGKVRVKVALTSTDKKVLDALKAKGLRISITEGKAVIGEVAVLKLLELTSIAEVRLIELAK